MTTEAKINKAEDKINIVLYMENGLFASRASYVYTDFSKKEFRY